MCELCITQLVIDQNGSKQTLSWLKLELLGCFQRSNVEFSRREHDPLGKVDASLTNRVKAIVAVF